METLLIILTVGIQSIVCFFVGAWVGQKVNRGERLEIPNPIKTIKGKEERQQLKAEQDRFSAIMRNIDRYDGTGSGQEDIPR